MNKRAADDLQKVVKDVQRQLRPRRIRVMFFNASDLARRLGVDLGTALAGLAVLAYRGKLQLRMRSYCAKGHCCSDTPFSEGFPLNKFCDKHKNKIQATSFDFFAVVIDKKKKREAKA
jgi:hypothetical protein